MNSALFVILFIHLLISLFTKQNLENGSSVFSDFLHEVRHLKSKKMADPDLPYGSRGDKKSKTWHKNEVFGVAVFRVLTKVLPINVYFLLEYEGTNGLLTFSKNPIFRKNLVLELCSRSSRPIRMQDFLIYNISKTSSGMKLNFCK